jgi:CRISPR-associated protein Csd1
MILQALAGYYERLLIKGKVPQPGWSSANVSFALSINEAGELLNVISLKQEVTRGKKTTTIPRKIRVPEQVKKAPGVVSSFLCENSSYLLGIDGKGKPERAQQCFVACKELHHNILSGVDDDGAKAVVNFFHNWNPEQACEHPKLVEYLAEIFAGANLIFIYHGEYVQDITAVKKVWQKVKAEKKDGIIMRCLVSGEKALIARLHPSIRGVRGAQSAGASLVSYNAPSYESYGKQQSFNAPVSEAAASAYTTALNYLLGSTDYHRIIGDTTIVYFAEDGEEIYQDFAEMLLFGDMKEQVTIDDLFGVVDKIVRGEPTDFVDFPLQPENRFYLLGIAPNAARLSVRFFWQDSFGKFVEHIAAHYRRLEIVKPEYEKVAALPIWRLLQETVNPNSKDKSASPLLGGAVLRAVLNNTAYPAALINQTMIRIRAEKKISYGKAAIIKAYWLMSGREKNKEVLQVMLNEESTNIAYVLGRTFAVLEAVQEAANPGIKATIKDRYFNSAATTPSVIFPMLYKLANSHLKKIGKEKEGYKISYSKQLGALADKIYMDGVPIPKRMSLEEQGIFILGYYHQTQKRFEKKEEKADV